MGIIGDRRMVGLDDLVGAFQPCVSMILWQRGGIANALSYLPQQHLSESVQSPQTDQQLAAKARTV